MVAAGPAACRRHHSESGINQASAVFHFSTLHWRVTCSISQGAELRARVGGHLLEEGSRVRPCTSSPDNLANTGCPAPTLVQVPALHHRGPGRLPGGGGPPACARTSGVSEDTPRQALQPLRPTGSKVLMAPVYMRRGDRHPPGQCPWPGGQSRPRRAGLAN